MRTIATLRLGAALFGLTALAACAARTSSVTATPTPQPLLLASRGVPMSLAQVMQKTAFRPILPTGNIVAFAVIPPLGGTDTAAHRGIAIEYRAQGHRLLLSQWPRQNFSFAIGARDITRHPCSIVHYSARGVMWMTRGNFVMTLQPDGQTRPKIIDAQARRLLTLSGCRSRR